jgi:hypothetical protein
MQRSQASHMREVESEGDGLLNWTAEGRSRLPSSALAECAMVASAAGQVNRPLYLA